MPDRARRPAHEEWAPADLNGHIIVPSDGCFQVTLRARRSRFMGLAAPLIRAGDRRLGDALTTGGRGPRPSGSRGASAIDAGSRGSASSGIRSPPFLGRISIGAERVGRPPPGLQPRMLPLHHAPPISSEPENTESSRSQYAGKPATGRFGLGVVEIRVMVRRARKAGLFQRAAGVRSKTTSPPHSIFSIL